MLFFSMRLNGISIQLIFSWEKIRIGVSTIYYVVYKIYLLSKRLLSSLRILDCFVESIMQRMENMQTNYCA